MRNTRKKWATLHADALQEIQMTQQPNSLQSQSNAPVVEAQNTSGMTCTSQVTNVLAHKVDSSEVAPANVADAVLPAQPGPRDGQPANPKVL